MTYATIAKIGAAFAAAALYSWLWFHLGGLSNAKALADYKTSVEAQHTAQLEAVVDTMDRNAKAARDQDIKQQGIISDLQEQLLKPLPTTGFVERMRVVEGAACATGNSQLAGAGAVAEGTVGASGIPRGDAEGDGLLQSALDAAWRDSARLNAAIALAKLKCNADGNILPD